MRALRLPRRRSSAISEFVSRSLTEKDPAACSNRFSTSVAPWRLSETKPPQPRRQRSLTRKLRLGATWLRRSRSGAAGSRARVVRLGGQVGEADGGVAGAGGHRVADLGVLGIRRYDGHLSQVHKRVLAARQRDRHELCLALRHHLVGRELGKLADAAGKRARRGPGASTKSVPRQLAALAVGG